MKLIVILAMLGLGLFDALIIWACLMMEGEDDERPNKRQRNAE
jgi:hypothetical protein